MDNHMLTFTIVAFVVFLIVAGVLIANIVYSSMLLSGDSLSNSQITSFLWASTVVLIIVTILVVWCIFVMVKYWKKKKVNVTQDVYTQSLGIDDENKKKYEEMHGVRRRTNYPQESFEPSGVTKSYGKVYTDDESSFYS